MDPAAALELLYPQSKKDYEAYIDRIVKLLKRHEEAEEQRRKAFYEKHEAPAKKEASNEWYIAALGELLARALEDSDPDEIKAFAGRLGEVGNKKLEQQAKEQGRKKVVIGGRMALDGRAGVDEDYGDHEGDGGEVVDAAEDEAAMERIAQKDAAAKALAAKKAAEAKELQDKLMAGKAPPRKVDTSQFAAMGMMAKKKDDDMFGGFGGKKGKKKK